jgi:hypothetical protein
MMNDKIKSALDEVRKFHPQVTMVIFNKFGQWHYCDDNFDSPIFGDEINYSILEDASDSVEILPSVFHL